MTTELTRRGSRTPEPDQAKGRRGRAGKKDDDTTSTGPRESKKRTPKAGPTKPAMTREEPRVDLLPPEVKSARRHDAIARRLVLALGVVILVMGSGVAGSTLLALQADSTLAASQAETESLASEQQKYADVRTIQNRIALTQAGQEVGASTDIDWTAFLGKVRATIGGGLALTGITIDSSSPLAAYEQSSVPLQGTRVATVTIDVKAQSLDQVSAWLAQLAELPAVADVAPGSVTLDESGYSASAIMHLNEAAFDGRFAAKGK